MYRLGISCEAIQLGELAVINRDGEPVPVPIIQILSGGLVVVNSRELFGCAGADSPDRFSMFLRNGRRVRFVTLGRYREPTTLASAFGASVVRGSVQRIFKKARSTASWTALRPACS